MKKIPKSGFEKIQLHDIAYESFSDMGYFRKFIPEDSKLIKVQFCHEFGIYEEPDTCYIAVEWERN